MCISVCQYLHDPSMACSRTMDGGYAGSKLTVVDAGDVDELLLGAHLYGLQRRRVPGPLRDVAALPIDDTSSHLFTPCVLRSCTNHPAENKTNVSCWIRIAATGAHDMKKIEK